MLDEADRLLALGFLPTLELIVSQLPKDRQTLLPAQLRGTPSTEGGMAGASTPSRESVRMLSRAPQCLEDRRGGSGVLRGEVLRDAAHHGAEARGAVHALPAGAGPALRSGCACNVGLSPLGCVLSATFSYSWVVPLTVVETSTF